MALVERWQPIDLREDPDVARYEGDPGLLPDVYDLLAAAQRPAWQERAACRGLGPGAWFPPRGRSAAPATTICAGCPVAEECSDAGMSERHGVWGGTSERQRRQLRRTAA